MKLPLFTLLILLLLFANQMFAQDGKVKVVDATTGETMAGVSVAAKDRVMVTDAEGVFDLKKIYSDADTLELTFVGYGPTKILAADIEYNTILMTPTEFALKEVKVLKNYLLRDGYVNYEELASLKMPIFAAGTALVGDSIYVVGGDRTIGSYQDNVGNLQIYNINTGEWTMSDIKFLSRAYHNAHYKDGKLYVLGGKYLAPNPKLEYLNNHIEVLHMATNKVITSSVNPHQAVNFTSDIYDDNIIVMNGSVKRFGDNRSYTNKAHLLQLKTGLWYELENMPYACETQGVVVDSVLYQIGGHQKVLLSSINAYHIPTGKVTHVSDLPERLERPAVAYNPSKKEIYIYENSKFMVYNVLTNKLETHHIELDIVQSMMIYHDGYAYIIGGLGLMSVSAKEGKENILIDTYRPSPKFYRVDVNQTILRNVAQSSD